MLGVNIDSKLNFDCHVNHLCNKANKKLRALARVTPYMTLEKKKIVMNSFFNAQFNYCPLIWMLHSRKNNNKIKHLHERCLRLIYSDKKSSYENLLEKDNSVSIHHKNIQALAIELEILHQCGKRVKTKSHKVLGAIFYVRRSYRGKTGRGPF